MAPKPGATWSENIPGVPKASWVSWVEASRFDPATAYAVFDRHTFGDTAPYAFKTTDYGKTWTSVVSSESGVRGFAHVIKEDTEAANLLFMGTEFGLWVSPDGGKVWAQYKGNDFPDVPVRDIVEQPRESDLVVATHGRGIWIIDDITPLRKLTSDAQSQDAVFLSGKPAQQRFDANGGWAEGAASFRGANPADAALITYYQKKRNIYGKIKLEVFDEKGNLVDTLTANSRRGISRVEWPMRLKAPHVPPAATAAFEAAQGPRVLPGIYTVKLTRGKEVYTAKLDVKLDARAKFSLEDRKQEYAASMRVYNLLGDMSFDVDRINAVHDELVERAAKAGKNAQLTKRLNESAARLEEMRKKIVATTEGGAVTGELRIREKTTELYGEILGYEGRPADYQIDRIDSLTRELGDVATEFDTFVSKDLPGINASLAKSKLPQIKTMDRKAWDAGPGSGGVPGGAGSHIFWERD